jgi:glycosyltransferase involved in cell wall biosynthesis
MKIRAFTNSTGSAWWRLESVAAHINQYTDHEMLCFNAKEWSGDTLDGDIVIFQMVVSPKAIRDAQMMGAKVIYEVDDLITERVNRAEVDKTDDNNQVVKDTVALADMVTTTTEELAKEMRKYNKNVVVLPNMIDLTWWGEALRTKRNDEIRIGWAGSTSHKTDLIYIRPVIKKILENYDNTRFIYCGAGGISSSSSSTELMYGEDLFKDLPAGRREHYLGINTELWGLKSKSLYFDIAIAPLVSDKFNDCKSNIKWQEYSLNGWAGVYSDEPPYSDIKHALKAKDQDEFYEHIAYLIENPEERKKMAKLARREVLTNWTLDHNYKKWVKAYKKCLNQ